MDKKRQNASILKREFHINFVLGHALGQIPSLIHMFGKRNRRKKEYVSGLLFSLKCQVSVSRAKPTCNTSIRLRHSILYFLLFVIIISDI